MSEYMEEYKAVGNECEFTTKSQGNNPGSIPVVVGQYDFIEKLVVCLLSGGHVLVEGVPGLAKTLASKVMSKTIRAEFKRVQFTPDLMPADIIGTKVLIKSGEFYLKRVLLPIYFCR